MLARHVVDRLDATVLALTGSQGKTGTKDYLAQVLAQAGETVATAGNINNEIGVPLTVLRATPRPSTSSSRWAPAASGTSPTCATSRRRRVAAVLNIGTAHLGEFGSREAIAVAKGEIIEALPETGTAVLNADDELTAALASRTRAGTLTFGTAGDVGWRGVELDDLGRPSFELGYDGAWHPVRLTAHGRPPGVERGRRRRDGARDRDAPGAGLRGAQRRQRRLPLADGAAGAR